MASLTLFAHLPFIVSYEYACWIDTHGYGIVNDLGNIMLSV